MKQTKDITRAVESIVSEHRSTRKIVAALIVGAFIGRSNAWSRADAERKAEIKSWVDWVMEEI